MALYKEKRQKTDQTKTAYTEDYRTRKSTQAIKTAVFIVILLALFALGYFVIEPLLENYYNDSNGESGHNGFTDFNESNVVDVDGLFSDED